MNRPPPFRGFALCLALLPLACAQQRSDGSLPGADAGDLLEVGGGEDAGDPDTGTVDKDTGAALVEDLGTVEPEDVGVVGADDVGTAVEDVGYAEPDAGSTEVDVGTPAVDVGTPDTGPRCTGTTVDCSGACVNTQTSTAHCGGCGRTCATGQSCVAGACTLVCAAPTVVCGGACANLQTSTAHCGMCDRACAMGATCAAGRCVGGVIPGPSFQVGLTPNNCAAIDHEATTGDDRGGIALSSERIFYSGDTSTGRFDIADLGHPEAVGRIYDALVSDLATGTLYTLAIGSTPLTQTGGAVTTLMALNGTTGGLTGTFVNLSQPIDLPATGSVGIFSGYERVILMGGGRAWHVSLPSGAVIDLGAVALPAARTACENWAIWGTAEFYGDALYVDYVQSATVIARMRVPQGTTTPIATFAGGLGDMCSFTVSPLWRRWYFHHETASQFRNVYGETVGYCDVAITGPTLPCRPIDTMCSGACTDLQTSRTHCGMCGRACAAGESCTAGVCGLACPAGQSACGGVCVDTTSSATNCGMCGRTCVGAQWCSNGVCGGGTRYVATTPSITDVPYIDACSATGSRRELVDYDDYGVSVTVPFATRWWGAPLAAGFSVYVVTNGNVQIAPSFGLTSLSGNIPDSSSPNGLIAPQWRDLRTSTSGVCIATTGAAPNRRWVAQWVGASNYSGGGTLNFEVVVHEGTGIVDLAYGAMTSPQTATVGLENNAGTAAFGGCGGTSTSCVTVSNSRVRFTPTE